jgi:hypothetical protein
MPNIIVERVRTMSKEVHKRSALLRKHVNYAKVPYQWKKAHKSKGIFPEESSINTYHQLPTPWRAKSSHKCV